MLSPAEATGSRIRHLLKKSGHTQQEFGEAIGVAQQGVSKRLIGEIPFDVNELAAAAAFLNVPLDALFPADKASA